MRSLIQRVSSGCGNSIPLSSIEPMNQISTLFSSSHSGSRRLPQMKFKVPVLYEQGIFETSVGEANQQSAMDLGLPLVLLIEMFNRIQTIDPRDAHSVEVPISIDTNLNKLESLPAPPQSVRNSIHGCRLTYDEIRREVALRNRELGH
jgi:hypothetical protein